MHILIRGKVRVIVQTLSQMRQAAREKSREVVVVGELASAIKRAFEEPEEIEAEDDLYGLLNAYDVVDYRNIGQYEGLMLCRKVKQPDLNRFYT